MSGLLCSIVRRRAILGIFYEKNINRNSVRSLFVANQKHKMYPKRLRTSGQGNFYPPPPPEPTLVRCGDLWEGYEGHFVRLRGRVVKSRLGRFIELRDSRGIAQLVADDEKPKILRLFQTLPIDSYVTVYGVVKPRLKPNVSIPTGRVEVHVDDIRDIDYPRPPESPGPGQQHLRSYSTTTNTPPLKTRSITSVEYKRINGVQNLMDRFSNRETTCGQLRSSDVGRKVSLVGWIEQKKHGKFLHLRDGYGNTQIVIDHENPEVKNVVAALTPETFVNAVGYVVARPASNINMAFETGDIEVICEEFKAVDPTVPYDGPIIAKNVEPMVEDEFIEPPLAERPSPKVNKYTTRTHTCGQLCEDDIGKEVTLCGWLEYERMRKFFTLRDGYGVTQVILPEDSDKKDRIENIPYESILEVTGLVMGRPPGMRNESLPTGTVEVILKNLRVLNPAKRQLPIQMREHNRAKEALRMEYRYMDLRFSDMQKNIRTRSKVLMKMREFLCNHAGFIEVETPTLFRKTPGGAQEFVVPTRRSGYFYSLVQSPQQFKQMLMVGAIDRYFQIARCYRDEATRPDRQPEFTQLDIELSFTDRDKILELIENVLVHCWPDFCNPLTTPFPRITYHDAMEKYGSDKPDIRFEMFLKNVTDALSLNTELVPSDAGDFGASALVIKAPNSAFPGAVKDDLNKIAQQQNDAKFYAVTIGEKPVETPGLIKTVGPEAAGKLVQDCNLEKDDLILFAFGDKEAAQLLMGRIRLAMRHSMEQRGIYTPPTGFNLCWIIDFPMFCKSERPDALDSVHHPFTAIHPDDLANFNARTDLLKVRSLAYDLVLNGQEIGGGSIRIHEPMQQRNVIVDYLKLNLPDFTHMIEALQSGCPPHGGIALGLDRLLAIMCNTDSIRDVIAFPKGLDGKDHLSKAPTPLSDEDKELYSLEIKDKASAQKNQLAPMEVDENDVAVEEAATTEEKPLEKSVEC